jgi:hypothetical protein
MYQQTWSLYEVEKLSCPCAVSINFFVKYTGHVANDKPCTAIAIGDSECIGFAKYVEGGFKYI